MASKCIILLSTKSAGSSACQAFLARTGMVRHIENTRHFENETLYWTKAASILGRRQISMLDSEVPIEKNRARKDLLDLLDKNLDSFVPPESDEALIFDGWRQLCERFSPVFLEKSPHHLHQWSNLELILECIERLPDIDFHIIGLIRNPMDNLYSAWKRWKTPPEKNQYQWLTAYTNLQELNKLLNGKVSIIRYEDMVADPKSLQNELKFIGCKLDTLDPSFFHQRSVAGWRKDSLFGFKLANDVVELAMEYGYEREALINERNVFFWGPYSRIARIFENVRKPIRRARNALKTRIG